MHDLAHARLARGLGEPDRTDDVDGGIELRVGHRVAYVDLRGQVKDHLRGVFGDYSVQVGLDDVVLDECELGIRLGGLQVRHLAGGQIVQSRYLVPVRQQAINQRRSDESCSSGNHCPHVATPSVFA
ncbi:Uncharacterised protein [Mycobacteroides abscessus]|nr:Uncharacterised protein [Mycobacteroides abscessus]